jgi:hypothetical protein
LKPIPRRAVPRRRCAAGRDPAAANVSERSQVDSAVIACSQVDSFVGTSS